MHVIPKPVDYGALGHYRAVLTTGTIAAGAGALSELIQMRWVDASKLAVIQQITIVEFRAITTAFAAGRFMFDVIRSTAWSADGTGGGAVAVTDPQMQLRTSMGNSLFSTGFRLATTAALGAGTKTFDTNPMGMVAGHAGTTPTATQEYIPAVTAPVTGGAGPGVDLYSPDTGNAEHPIVLANNEGVSVRATVPATGTWTASFLVKWAEVTAY
jgi:hypothetical protein